jgi:hypothetical protein
VFSIVRPAWLALRLREIVGSYTLKEIRNEFERIAKRYEALADAVERGLLEK